MKKYLISILLLIMFSGCVGAPDVLLEAEKAGGTVTKGQIGKQDIYIYTGDSTERTFSRGTSTGYDITLNAVDWVGVDALMVYGGGVNRTNATITSTLAGIGTDDDTEIWIAPGTWTISANVDWSSYTNVTIRFAPGAILSHGAYTIDLYSPDLIESGPVQQIFSGEGTVSFSVPGVQYSAWWGTDGDAIQSALTAMLSKGTTIIPAGSTDISTELTIGSINNWTVKSEGGKFGTRLEWTGAVDTSMLTITGCYKWNLEGISFDANALAKYALYLKATALLVTTNWSINSCEFVQATEACLKLGDYDLVTGDYNVSTGTVTDTLFWSAKYGVYTDSSGVAAVNFIDCQWQWATGMTAGDHHIYMKRAASINIFGGYIGLIGKADTWAIRVSDGRIALYGLHSEAGITGDFNSGFMKINAPTHTSVIQPHLLDHCTILCDGTAANEWIIDVDTGANPLIATGCVFKDSTWHDKNINLSGTARYYSYSNVYYTTGNSPFTPANTVISLGDSRTADGTTFTPMASINGIRFKDLTGDTTLTAEYSFVSVTGTSADITLTLPEAADAGGHEYVIYKYWDAYTLIINRSGTDTIGNGSDTTLELEKIYDYVILRSNAVDKWVVVGMGGVTDQQAVSSGAGSVKMGSANTADNAGWLEIQPNRFIPYWTDMTP